MSKILVLCILTMVYTRSVSYEFWSKAILFRSFGFIAHTDLQWFDFLVFRFWAYRSVPVDGYSRNQSCALDYQHLYFNRSVSCALDYQHLCFNRNTSCALDYQHLCFNRNTSCAIDYQHLYFNRNTSCAIDYQHLYFNRNASCVLDYQHLYFNRNTEDSRKVQIILHVLEVN